MNNKDYRISNIYYMLAYAFRFDKLIPKSTDSGGVEEFDNIYDLFSVMLYKMISLLIKRGFYKDYETTIEISSLAKGKIKIDQSIKQNTLISQKLVCEFDDFSDNINLNQIIKTTLFYLIKSEKLKKENKKKIKKVYLFFDDIDTLDIRTIRWNRIILNKSNKGYRVVINICYLILNNLIITQENGEKKYKEFLEDEELAIIYERFVREYYIKHYPQLKPSVKKMQWNIDQGYPMIDFLPTMITDINLYYKNKELIIDTKFYANILKKGRYNKEIISRDNWNQLFAYVSNESYNSNKIVSGMLLYAQTDEEIASDNTTSVMGHKMSIKVLDLRKNINQISEQLNTIANQFISD
ncbi:MAG TPA: 5-methylcytosine-specific restriction endonuclease system specificity protein McrC [Candidatus Faecimonas gallistercoris]|nr:5-methylcytosine-specific restriction endonuclease system specificity protein McrC [Candidatus Faecimonas gallistercoris]